MMGKVSRWCGRYFSKVVSLNLPVDNAVNLFYYKQWTNKRKYFCVKEGLYDICTIWLKACIKEVPDYLSIKNIFSLQNCIILVKLFDEKVHIYETSYNNLNKNKSAIKWLQRIKKVLTSKITLSKKIGGMHEKGEFSKIKRSVWNVFIETASTYFTKVSSSRRISIVFVKTCFF